MTDKHTPGPWHICEYANIGARCQFAVSTGEARDAYRLADVLNDNGHEAANARLIAAAPELLAALRECEHKLQSLQNEFTETGRNGDAAGILELRLVAKDAIAKAVQS